MSRPCPWGRTERSQAAGRGRARLSTPRLKTRDGERLAGAGTTRDDGEATSESPLGGFALAEVGLLSPEELFEDRLELAGVDGEPALAGATTQQVIRNLFFEAPVALEVQTGPVKHERQDVPARSRSLGWSAHGRARRYEARPSLRVRPGERTNGVTPHIVDHHGLGHGFEHDADVPKARGTSGEGGAEENLSAKAARAASDNTRDVDSRGVEQPRLDKGRERGDLVPKQRTEALHDATSAPSSRSLRASTRACGTRQENTPCGSPSTTGVVAPVMPRTNRYAAPPRCRAGS